MSTSPAEEDVRAAIRERPPERTLAWVAEAIGEGARVDGVMVLHGGGACAIHAVDVCTRRGVRHGLVLKRFFRRSWVEEEPDVAEREARVLEGLVELPLPTPELVAVDPRAERCDFPAVLMTRLPGRVELFPDDREAWLRCLAEPIPKIHQLGSSLCDDVRPYFPYKDLASLSVPAWSSEPEAWRALIELVQRPAPQAPTCFIHRDYHPTNVLFTQGVVTAVLDWTNASRGPAGVDAGHCRLNLVCLYGVETAERFRELLHEQSEGTEGTLDPTWDAFCLIETLPAPSVYWGWVNLGVRGLTVELLQSRLDGYAHLLASRL